MTTSIENILRHKPSGAPTATTVYLFGHSTRDAVWKSASEIPNPNLIRDYFQKLPLQLQPNTRTRILLLGNAGVGKSSLIRRLSDRELQAHYQPTDFYAASSVTSHLDIIEMPGSELHRLLPLQCFSFVDRIVVMLAMDDAETLYTYAQWIIKFQHLGKPVRLLVNKSDLDADPQTTVFTLMSLHDVQNPWRFVSCLTDTKERLLHALVR